MSPCWRKQENLKAGRKCPSRSKGCKPGRCNPRAALGCELTGEGNMLARKTMLYVRQLSRAFDTEGTKNRGLGIWGETTRGAGGGLSNTALGSKRGGVASRAWRGRKVWKNWGTLRQWVHGLRFKRRIHGDAWGENKRCKTYVVMVGGIPTSRRELEVKYQKNQGGGTPRPRPAHPNCASYAESIKGSRKKQQRREGKKVSQGVSVLIPQLLRCSPLDGGSDLRCSYSGKGVRRFRGGSLSRPKKKG